MIMRDTVFCAIGPDADHDAIRASIHEMVDAVREYVPGYTMRAEPQFDDPSDHWGGNGRVGVFLEVKGNGDFLPPYAGNLDIMTAAAARVGELMARNIDDWRRPAHEPPDRTSELAHDVRITDTTLRDGSHAMAHRFTEDQVRDTVRASDAAGVEVIEVAHGDGIGGSSFTYGFSRTDEMTLIAAAAEEARAGEDRGAAGARHRHRRRPAPRTRRRRDHGARRHPLHRGRRLAAALRRRPRAWAWRPRAS